MRNGRQKNNVKKVCVQGGEDMCYVTLIFVTGKLATMFVSEAV
jgi:hypothetical protein